MKLNKKLLTIIIIGLVIVCMGAFAAGCYPLVPSEDTGTTDAAAADGTQTEATGVGSLFARYGTWIWLAVLVVAFYFLLIRPQRMRSKKAQDLMSSLQRGDEVVTIGGFHGRIKDIREDAIKITIASGVDVKVNKSAVSKKVANQ